MKKSRRKLGRELWAEIKIMIIQLHFQTHPPIPISSNF